MMELTRLTANWLPPYPKYPPLSSPLPFAMAGILKKPRLK